MNAIIRKPVKQYTHLTLTMASFEVAESIAPSYCQHMAWLDLVLGFTRDHLLWLGESDGRLTATLYERHGLKRHYISGVRHLIPFSSSFSSSSSNPQPAAAFHPDSSIPRHLLLNTTPPLPLYIPFFLHILAYTHHTYTSYFNMQFTLSTLALLASTALVSAAPQHRALDDDCTTSTCTAVYSTRENIITSPVTLTSTSTTWDTSLITTSTPTPVVHSDFGS